MLVYVFDTHSIAFNRLNCSPDKMAHPRTVCANFHLNGPFDFQVFARYMDIHRKCWPYIYIYIYIRARK